MQQGRALGVALMIVCSSVGGATAEETKPTNAIRVVEATYGGNCAGVAKGNVTKYIASACDGTDLCNYRVYYKNMSGDPAADCRKAFRVTYVCGKNKKPRDVCLRGRGWHGWRRGRGKQFLPSALFERRLARASEGETERGRNSSRCRSPPTHCTSSYTKYPTTITTMAMAVSRPLEDWLKFKNPAAPAMRREGRGLGKERWR
jgi:hypothetical protein